MTIGCYTVTRNPDRDWLKEATDSVAKCGFKQYVLFDDGSDPKVEGAHARFTRNKGVSEARNAAIGLLKTQWVAMLDDDDVFIPENVAKLMALLPKTEADIVSFPIELFGDETGYWAVDPDMSRLLDGNQIPAGSWIRREVWEALRYKAMDAEDWDLWARAMKSRFNFSHFNLPIYRHRVRKGSLSRDWTGERFSRIREDVRKSHANHKP